MKKKVWILLAFIIILACIGCSRTSKTNDISKEYAVPEFPGIQEQTNKFSRTPEKAPQTTEKKRPPIVAKNVKGIVPSRLYIPSIGLHADIEPVGVLDNGQMDVPKSTDNVGYLTNGILPGAVGNAVMDGHVDHYKGPAVFFRLRTLKKGDEVIVKNEKGHFVTFVVEAVETYKTSEAPIPRIFGPSADPRLNLITCTGKYSRKKKEHQERLVVYTKRSAES